MGNDGRPYTMSNRLFFRRSGHSVWVHSHLFLRSFPIQTHNVTVSLSNSFCFHWLHISQGNTIFHSTKQSPVCSGQPYAYYGVQYWHTSPIIHKKGSIGGALHNTPLQLCRVKNGFVPPYKKNFRKIKKISSWTLINIEWIIRSSLSDKPFSDTVCDCLVLA